MTTSRSDHGRPGGAASVAHRAAPPGYLEPKKGQGASSWPARAAWLLSALIPAAPLAAQELTLPSGHAATLFDVLLEQGGQVLAPDAGTALEETAGDDLGDGPLDQPPVPASATDAEALEDEAIEASAPMPAGPLSGLARFRLVVPSLGGEGAAFEDVAANFLWVCEEVALPALAANGWTPTEVVVSLSDRETAFGAPDPEAVQFFEGFRIADRACVPQAF